MSTLSRFFNLLRSGDLEKEFDEELAFHLAQRVTANVRSGMSKEEAELAAVEQFGNVAQIKQEMWEARMMNVRFAALLGVGITAILCWLALGGVWRSPTPILPERPIPIYAVKRRVPPPPPPPPPTWEEFVAKVRSYE
jgi:hypothetical protein